MPKISVIIPFYNCEKYIERCARSLFEQTLEDIEFIFVNDCSSDHTVYLLKTIADKYPKRNIKIIHHVTNKGVAAARSTGLAAASGEYVIHCDSDDWVDADYYEALYNKAISCDADIVVGNYIEEYSDIRKKFDSPHLKNWQELKHYPDWLFLSLWNRLVRKSLIVKHELDFYQGINCAEDLGFMLRAYFFSKINAKCHESYYHYSKCNNNSITHKSHTSIEYKDQSRICIELLCKFLEDHYENPMNCNLIKTSMKNIKESYLSVNDFKSWKYCFPEVTPYVIKSLTPPSQSAGF